MKATTLLFLITLACVASCVSPQQDHSASTVVNGLPAEANGWTRDSLDPAATELWVSPPKVTPGEAGTPPSDAIVLFDGSGLSAWEATNGTPAKWIVAEDAMTIKSGESGIRTKQAFGSIQLHIEFQTPAPEDMEGSTGQGRGNSGIFFMGRYEIQILDSYGGTTYGNGQAGAIYKQYPPLVNASLPPQTWQSYDVIFLAPVFGENGQVVRPATITAFHNGVLIQNHATMLGPTQYRGLPSNEPHAAKHPLMLQAHGNPVSFRNVWVREL